MRKFILAILILLLGSVLAFADHPPEIEKVVENLCVLECKNGEYKDHTTGTLLKLDSGNKNGVILTCAHLFDDPAPVTVYFPKTRQEFNGNPIKIDRAGDVALVEIVGRPNLPGVEMAAQESDVVGDYRCVLGFESAYKLRILQCQVTSRNINYGKMVTVTAPSQLGMSGGPIVTRDGKIASVVSGSGGDLPLETLACSQRQMAVIVRPIFPFLYRWRQRRAIQRARAVGDFVPINVQCPDGNCGLPYQQPAYQPIRQNFTDSRITSQNISDINNLPVLRDAVERNKQEISILQQRVSALEQAPTPTMDFTAIKSEITQDVLARMPTPEPGRVGPRGPQGEPGRDAELTNQQIQLIAESIANSLPPVRIQVIDSQGRKSISEGRLGDTLQLELFDK